MNMYTTTTKTQMVKDEDEVQKFEIGFLINSAFCLQ